MGYGPLERAQAGDPDAFATLVEPHRDELRVHCYRMLGSLVEAEDVLQEVLHAAWRGLPVFEGRSSVRTWLYRIATNRCLNARRDASRRQRRVTVMPFTPPVPSRHGDLSHLQPFPDRLLPSDQHDPMRASEARESVELAFIAALQRLPGRQVAALVLHDVVGYDRHDVAALLDTSPTSVKGLLQRARTTIVRHRDTTARPPSPNSEAQQAVANRFACALLAGDVNGMVQLLTSDAVLAMPPPPHEYVGPSAIREFLLASHRWLPNRRVKIVALRANTQPAFIHLLADSHTGEVASVGVVVLTIAGDCVRRITRFLDPSIAARLLGDDDAHEG